MDAKKAGGVVSGAECVASRRPARDRIFETAKELFYQHGIRAVGVDAIAASADATKMTLYRNFPSKDELVAEILREEVKEYWSWWDEIVCAHAGDPRGTLVAIIEAYAEELAGEENCYGCALANAAIELHDETHPARKVAVEHRLELRRRFAELAREAGADDQDLADGLMMLIEGCSTSRATLGARSPAQSLARIGRKLIDAYLPRP